MCKRGLRFPQRRPARRASGSDGSSSEPRVSSLTATERALERCLAGLGHGVVSGRVNHTHRSRLLVDETIIRTVKFGAKQRRSLQPSDDDFVLKRHVVELFETLRRLQDGTAVVIKVADGLPIQLTITESAAAGAPFEKGGRS